jgi:hypothetical protein
MESAESAASALFVSRCPATSSTGFVPRYSSPLDCSMLDIVYKAFEHNVIINYKRKRLQFTFVNLRSFMLVYNQIDM